MRSSSFQPVPATTARAAKSVFNIANLYLSIGGQLDSLFGDLDLDGLDAFGEKPVSTLFLLAMVTLFQFAEGLPDRQAADAVRTRLDWKYALHLPLDYPGIDHTTLGEFRQRLRLDKAGQVVFRRMLTRLAELGLWGSGDKPGVDVADVLSTIDTLSRVEAVATAMGQALEALASREPEWLRTISMPHWYERYGQSSLSQRSSSRAQELDALARAIGADIAYLLKAVAEADTPNVAQMAEIQALRQIWHQQFEARRGEPAPC